MTNTPQEYALQAIKVLLICLKPGCPRKLKINRPKDIPKAVATIKSYCPWHAEEGWKAYPEIWLDKDGKEIND